MFMWTLYYIWWLTKCLWNSKIQDNKLQNVSLVAKWPSLMKVWGHVFLLYVLLLLPPHRWISLKENPCVSECLFGLRALQVNNRKTAFTTPQLHCNKPRALKKIAPILTLTVDRQFCDGNFWIIDSVDWKVFQRWKGVLIIWKIHHFRGKTMIFTFSSSTQDLAGFSFSLFLLPVAPCARAPHLLPAPARALLLTRRK